MTLTMSLPTVLLLCLHFSSYSSTSTLPIGIHPLEKKLYEADVIKCKDGSKNFTRDRLNDNFCDCPDGTDEPGTSACPASKFYCKNVGSTPKFLFSSRVNDHICDCCDGSDEYDGIALCPNRCVMGGNVAYQTINYGSNAKKRENGHSSEESSQKFSGLKVVIIIQGACIISVVTLIFLLFRRRAKGRRKIIR